MLSLHQLVIWVAAPIMQALIAAVMVRRKLSTEFPVFFAYTLFHVVQVAIELYCYFHSRALYFYAFWIMQAFDFLLVIAVIQEVFGAVLREYTILKRRATKIYRWAVLILVAVAFGTALLAPGTETDRTVAGLLTLDTSSMIIQLGVLAMLFMMSRMLVLGWGRMPFGIALGFGVMASVQLAVSLMRSYLGDSSTPGYVLLRPLAYNLAVLIWIFYATRRERRKDISALPPEDDMNRWNEALGKMSRF
jgi:hypothetical protein